MADRETKPLMSLTKRMADCLQVLYDHHKANALVGMTLTDIGAGLGLRSRSGVSRLVDGLVDRGYIAERQQHRWRSLRLTDAAIQLMKERERSDG